MIMMEEVPDAPVIMKSDLIVKTQNENIPINDNTCSSSIPVNTNVNTIDNNATDINTTDGTDSSTSTKNGICQDDTSPSKNGDTNSSKDKGS